MENNFKIWIPCKFSSKRFAQKNIFLLKNTIEYIKQEGFYEHINVTSDKPEMIYDKSVKSFEEKIVSENMYDNLRFNYRNWGWKKSDVIILMEPTKLFREKGLVNKVFEKWKQKQGIVGTESPHEIPVVARNKKDKIERIGLKILDNSVCCAELSVWLKIKSPQMFSDFISATVENRMPYIDIDYDYQLEPLKNLIL